MQSRFWRLRLLLLIILSGVVGSAVVAAIPNPAPIRLAFDYPTNAMNTNLVFILHGTQNVGSPPGNWPVDMVIPATNWYLPNGDVFAVVTNSRYVLIFTNHVTLSTTPRFWYITASNHLWGEVSDPSNVLALDAPPVKTGTLKAERAF